MACCPEEEQGCLEWRRKTPSSAFENEQDIAKQGKYWEDGHDGHERMRAADNWGNILMRGQDK